MKLPPNLELGTKSVTMDTKVLSAVDGEKSRFLPKTLRINLAACFIIGKGNNNENKKKTKKIEFLANQRH